MVIIPMYDGTLFRVTIDGTQYLRCRLAKPKDNVRLASKRLIRFMDEAESRLFEDETYQELKKLCEETFPDQMIILVVNGWTTVKYPCETEWRN